MAQKKILLINGHPDTKSFCYGLAEAYLKGAKASNAIVKQINIGEIEFNPNLNFGYRKRVELEPDLQQSIDKIKEADHII
ncbi:putative NADPH-quinone reductase [Flammeovirga kamogawensis]|nr:putative NADPH-quinone reductase [Flammeovirga kamogawensis]